MANDMKGSHHNEMKATSQNLPSITDDNPTKSGAT